MIGTTVGDYRISGKLGIGGMGVVYEAEDTRARRTVALKFLPPDLARDADALRRLRREAQVVASLDHPRICRVHAIHDEPGLACLVMECVDGVNLRVWASRQPVTGEDVRHIAWQIADALGAAHAAGVVHRDIKPANVMMAADGKLTLLDFGLARPFVLPSADDVDAGSTLPGRPRGTVSYMAPERILQSPPDPRSDLFSLGVLMYELMTGRLPFAADSPADVVERILDGRPEPWPLRMRAGCGALRPLVTTLLEADPARRPQSALEVAAALRPSR